MRIEWNSDKNQELIRSRGVSFEEVLIELRAKRILSEVEHPNVSSYPSQRIYFLRIRNYVYLVPYVERDGVLFLKTIIPSRKATRKFLRGGR